MTFLVGCKEAEEKFAGHETTSTCISWTIFLLWQNPEFKMKLLSEIDSIERIDYESVSNCNLLHECIQEVDCAEN